MSVKNESLQKQKRMIKRIWWRLTTLFAFVDSKVYDFMAINPRKFFIFRGFESSALQIHFFIINVH